MQKIKVNAHPDTKEIITLDENGETGSIMISCQEYGQSGSTGTFVGKQRRVLFIRGEVALLQELVKEFKLEDGSDYPLVKHIAVRESVTPFYENQKPLVNPKSGAELAHDGQPIYREYYASQDENVLDLILLRDKEPAAIGSASEIIKKLSLESE